MQWQLALLAQPLVQLFQVLVGGIVKSCLDLLHTAKRYVAARRHYTLKLFCSVIAQGALHLFKHVHRAHYAHSRIDAQLYFSMNDTRLIEIIVLRHLREYG